MSSSDMIPQDDNTSRQSGEDFNQHVPRTATDPFAPNDMPLALLEFHSPTAGLVNLPATPAARYIILLIGCLFLACVAAMALFPINRVVSTPGRLISTQPTIVVQPLETAIIRSIDVHVGDFVKKGDILAHLDPTITEADITNMRQQRDAYQAEYDRLKAEAAGQDYHANLNEPASVEQGAAFLRRKTEYQAHVENYAQQIASLESDIQGYRANAAMYGSKMRVASEVLQMRQREQADQVGSRLSTLGAQTELMEAERAEIAAQQSANSAEKKLAAMKAERDGYIGNWQAKIYSDLTEAGHHLAEYRSAFEKARLRQDLVLLRAPEDGVVLTIAQGSVGSVLQSAGQFITLVPTGYGLEMEAVMRSQDVGFVQVGDHALLKFATFPYDQYGGAEATVRVISADAFTPSSQNGSGGANGTSPSEDTSASGVYRVRLRIDRYTLHGQPSFFHPMPGMSVTADIDVGKRTVLQYLFNKITPAITNGMREP
ncbi:HlyD family type I secretion periplasmic adaptor subunit [Gluconobacter roseus]|uniref:Membrane fusion protein (MFP) family protein n=1 Tax=Gluconobacter roseus NBRC 3990 TaxID=1307950 RepID=A0A4Y3MAT6_9PROT|nr:HlyD family type I secretion periplasmic adaptor subunit [Gluconobacter roseus]KXV42897.1 multidrug ABC transporter [Gluconobacter roseus]GBR48777.1 major facilitator superfamily multidrug resistance transporter EmrA/FusE [Gluconobacter roseus NBRC 3990]GEB04381.1 HlyD family type I secretion periplasmic adaptor subunit [Gluconobacter roseus NBRC 3990]GLP92824.1 HlyD family type I secretion periplasmic adaptor subunit [Gluconobacter roseus NBRC 3990]